MNDNNAPHYTELPIAQLEENKGQIDGLPANPRNIQPDKLAKLKRSILDNPEMLQLRGILVYPHGDKYIVIGGNMRLRAMVELGMTSAPASLSRATSQPTSSEPTRSSITALWASGTGKPSSSSGTQHSSTTGALTCSASRPPCMDALSLQDSSRYRTDFVAYMSSKSNSPFGTF